MIMLFGFITGSLARLAVPGPDPMPVWLTVAIGLVGSAAGGAIAIGIWGKQTQGIGIFSFFGVERFRAQRQQLEDMAQKARFEQATADSDSNLQKLEDLHAAGLLTDEELEAKKEQLTGLSRF